MVRIHLSKLSGKIKYIETHLPYWSKKLSPLNGAYILKPTLFIVLITSLLSSTPALAYKRATDSADNVKGKLYPKKGRVETGVKAGLVLNSSYVETYLVNAGITYFWSEEWGFALEGTLGLPEDKNERNCIETFYNDHFDDAADECAIESDLESSRQTDPTPNNGFRASYGPAYVPIRELKYLISGSMVWNPIYGKQIVLLSAVGHFDLFIAMGGGVTISDYYDLQNTMTSNGNPARGTSCPRDDNGQLKDPSCTETPFGSSDPNDIGETGRPEAEQQTHLTSHFSLGQRFHFGKKFMITAEIKNYTLLGTPAGFDNFLTLLGGVGIRF